MKDSRKMLFLLFVFLILFTMVIGFALPQVERVDPRANILTNADGLWWAIATVTSVGYGDHFPVTPAGRSLGIALIMIGLSTFFTLISLATVVIFQRDEERHISRILKKIDRLEHRMERLADEIALDKQRKKNHMEHS
ncbi:MAG: potassium channel family protein [Patescibacteria group bacterium]|nr:potassium channel family protein [Patescibacteria group bacterium]